MEQQSVERRLTTILSADVVGYSRLMGEDEAGTLAALKLHRKELIDPKAAQYKGRTVKLMGDGALMEFLSVVDAVAFAIEVQIAMRQRNSDVPDERQIQYRVGINIGDVIVEDEDIFGDGVNVAARLEELAEPGGICVSGSVFDHVKGKMELRFEDLGDQEMKNIAEPVRVYRLHLESEGSAKDMPTTSRSRLVTERTSGGFSKIPIAAMAAIIILGLVLGLLWWQPWEPREEPASLERMAFALPERPSIAVLPFKYLGNDPDQEFLIDGMTNDITTDLSRFGDLMVIASNSTFAYKDKTVKVQQVAEELGVHYIVEGSVQNVGKKLRVNAKFIDALSGEHLWAERYERDLNDLFAVQDEITQSIVSVLGGYDGRIARAGLGRVHKKNPTTLSAYELLILSISKRHLFKPEINVEARELAERAIEIDPQYARAHVAVAFNHYLDYLYGWSTTPDVSLKKMGEFAKKAVELDETEAEAHWILADFYYMTNRHDEAIAEFQRAMSLNPNNPDILAEYGWVLPFMASGKAEDAVAAIKEAKRINPLYPDWYDQGLGIALYFARKYEEAITALKAVQVHVVDTRSTFAASYAQLGQLDRAQAEAAKILELKPDFSINWWIEKNAFKDPIDAEHYRQGLLKAGLPE